MSRHIFHAYMYICCREGPALVDICCSHTGGGAYSVLPGQIQCSPHSEQSADGLPAERVNQTDNFLMLEQLKSMDGFDSLPSSASSCPVEGNENTILLYDICCACVLRTPCVAQSTFSIL